MWKKDPVKREQPFVLSRTRLTLSQAEAFFRNAARLTLSQAKALFRNAAPRVEAHEVWMTGFAEVSSRENNREHPSVRERWLGKAVDRLSRGAHVGISYFFVDDFYIRSRKKDSAPLGIDRMNTVMIFTLSVEMTFSQCQPFISVSNFVGHYCFETKIPTLQR